METIIDNFGKIIIVVIISAISIVWYASCRSAEIFNRQNQTNYSCSDFFWAESQINTQTQTIKLK